MKQQVLDDLQWMLKTYRALAGEDNDHSILRAILQRTITFISEPPARSGVIPAEPCDGTAARCEQQGECGAAGRCLKAEPQPGGGSV
jgi:hypothetical protein